MISIKQFLTMKVVRAKQLLLSVRDFFMISSISIMKNSCFISLKHLVLPGCLYRSGPNRTPLYCVFCPSLYEDIAINEYTIQKKKKRGPAHVINLTPLHAHTNNR